MSQLQGKRQDLIEQLSTGKRINRASDDPSGVIAATRLGGDAEKLVSEIDGLQRYNLVLATKDGALSVVQDMLLEATSLITQLANEGGLSEDEREGIKLELEGLAQGITQVLQSTTFNGQALFGGH